MDSLAGIDVFVKVVEQGGFTAAARELGLSKAAVSKKIARLEERLGARLLNRTTRRLSPTEVGVAYYERCRRVVEAAEEAELAVSNLQSEARGTLRVNAPMSFGILHLGPILSTFLSSHPALAMDLQLNDRRVDVVDEGFDAVIRVGELADSSLVARKLAPCRFRVVASPDYWDRRGRPDHPTELADHPAVIFDSTATPGVWHFRRGGESHRVAVDGPLRGNNGEVLLAAARGGLGVAVTPTFLLADGAGLEPVLSDWEIPPTAIWAIYPPTRHLSPKVRAFVDFLADAFGPEPYWDAAA